MYFIAFVLVAWRCTVLGQRGQASGQQVSVPDAENTRLSTLLLALSPIAALKLTDPVLPNKRPRRTPSSVHAQHLHAQQQHALNHQSDQVSTAARKLQAGHHDVAGKLGDQTQDSMTDYFDKVYRSGASEHQSAPAMGEHMPKHSPEVYASPDLHSHARSQEPQLGMVSDSLPVARSAFRNEQYVRPSWGNAASRQFKEKSKGSQGHFTDPCVTLRKMLQRMVADDNIRSP